MMKTLYSNQYLCQSQYLVTRTYKKLIENIVAIAILRANLIGKSQIYGIGTANIMKSRKSPSTSSTR